MENIINCIKEISEELKNRNASLAEAQHALKGDAIATICLGYEYGQLEDKRFFSKNGEQIIRFDRALTKALGFHSVKDWWRSWNGKELSPSGAIVASHANPNKFEYPTFNKDAKQKNLQLRSLYRLSDEELVPIAQKNTDRYIKSICEARKIAQEFGFDISVQDKDVVLNIIFAKLKDRRDNVTKESVEKDLQIAIGKLSLKGEITTIAELTNLFLKGNYKEVRDILVEIFK